MSQYTDNRSRFLAVPGGSIRPLPECICFARDAMQHEPECYRWTAGVLWGQWPECPTHGERFTSPVWSSRLGRLQSETDADQASVKVED